MAKPESPRRRALAVGLLVLAAAAATVLMSTTLQWKLFERAAGALTAVPDRTLLADDALRVAVCGSSAPLPSVERAKACVAVFAGGKFYVVDSGPESVENLVRWNIPLGEIGGVLLTHFHSDHIGELGELQLQTWAGGRPGPLPVYGGPGVEDVVGGFNRAYRHDQAYRTEHHGEAIMPSRTWGLVPRRVDLDGPATPAKDRTRVFLDDGALRITAIEVDHAPIEPAYAFRFDYRGRSAVVTGDYRKHAPLARAASGADLMLSEALSRRMTRTLENAANAADRTGTATIMRDIQDYHIAPEEAAELANEAGVGLLALYHLSPAPDGYLARQLFGEGVDTVRGDGWEIAEDGSLYTLPLGTQEIRSGKVGR